MSFSGYTPCRHCSHIAQSENANSHSWSFLICFGRSTLLSNPWCYGPEFVAKELRKWLAQTGAKTLYIEPGSPWENGYCESFNSKMRDEFLNGEIFYSLKEVRVLAERWRVYFNTERPHSSLGYRPPAPSAWQAEASQQHGKVESKKRFPLSHTA